MTQVEQSPDTPVGFLTITTDIFNSITSGCSALKSHTHKILTGTSVAQWKNQQILGNQFKAAVFRATTGA